jgi:hypothetical protein
MKKVLIQRYSSSKNGVQSNVLCGDDQWHGLERPWIDNLPFKSCIPTGTYTLLPWDSPHFGAAYIFIGGTVGVTAQDGERYACLIHPANYTNQLQGCLALGMRKSDYHEAQDSAAVWSSRDALNDFKNKVGYEDPLQVKIDWVY